MERETKAKAVKKLQDELKADKQAEFERYVRPNPRSNGKPMCFTGGGKSLWNAEKLQRKDSE